LGYVNIMKEFPSNYIINNNKPQEEISNDLGTYIRENMRENRVMKNFIFSLHSMLVNQNKFELSKEILRILHESNIKDLTQIFEDKNKNVIANKLKLLPDSDTCIKCFKDSLKIAFKSESDQISSKKDGKKEELLGMIKDVNQRIDNQRIDNAF